MKIQNFNLNEGALKWGIWIYFKYGTFFWNNSHCFISMLIWALLDKCFYFVVLTKYMYFLLSYLLWTINKHLCFHQDINSEAYQSFSCILRHNVLGISCKIESSHFPKYKFLDNTKLGKLIHSSVDRFLSELNKAMGLFSNWTHSGR